MRDSSGVQHLKFNWKRAPLGGTGWLRAGVDVSAAGDMMTGADTAGCWVRAAGKVPWTDLMTTGSLPVGTYGNITQNSDTPYGCQAMGMAYSNGNVGLLVFNNYFYQSTNLLSAVPTLKQIGGTYAGYASNTSGNFSGKKVQFDTQNPDVVLIGSTTATIYYSTNFTATTPTISSFAVPAPASGYYHSVLCDPSSTVTGGQLQRWYIGTSGTGISRSTTGVHGTYTAVTGAPANVLWMAIDSTGNVYAVDGGSNVYKATATGNFSVVGTTPGSFGAGFIAVNPTNQAQIVALAPAGTGWVTYISTDSGATWNQWIDSTTPLHRMVPQNVGWMQALDFNGTTSSQVAATFADSTGGINFRSDGTLFLASGSGIFKSVPPSAGQTWWWQEDTLGIEQSVITDVYTPTGGKPIYPIGDFGNMEIIDDTYQGTKCEIPQPYNRFTGYMAGGTLTIVSMQNGSITLGQAVQLTGSLANQGYIQSQSSGTTGGAGVYVISGTSTAGSAGSPVTMVTGNIGDNTSASVESAPGNPLFLVTCCGTHVNGHAWRNGPNDYWHVFTGAFPRTDIVVGGGVFLPQTTTDFYGFFCANCRPVSTHDQGATLGYEDIHMPGMNTKARGYLGSGNAQLIFTSVADWTGAQNYTVVVNAASGGGSVSVSGSTITVTPATTGLTATAIAAQINANGTAAALITTTAGGTGASNVVPGTAHGPNGEGTMSFESGWGYVPVQWNENHRPACIDKTNGDLFANNYGDGTLGTAAPWSGIWKRDHTSGLWSRLGASPASFSAQVNMRMVDGQTGHGYINQNGSALYRTSNSWASNSQVGDGAGNFFSGVTAAGCGKAAPGQSYPALYVYGTMSGQQGFWVCFDGSWTNWLYIAGSQYPGGFVYPVGVLCGHPDIFGRIDIGFQSGAGGIIGQLDFQLTAS